MISKTYYRYIWLLNLLLESGPLSFEEICAKWKDNPLADSQLPLRTFHEHRKGINEMFGVDIGCDKSKGNVYYVKNREVLDDNKLAKWLLHNYNVPEEFITYNKMRDRILLEEIPLGRAFVSPIIEAMQENVELIIDYQRYEGHNETFHIQPYALKVYHRHWYLLGFLKEQEAIRQVALDRILTLKKTHKYFTLPDGFDARKYYAHTVGIFVNEELKPEKVRIRVYGKQVEYIRALPLHRSQEEVLTKINLFSEFEYKVCLTPELISQLLAMGENVEVLKPESLRERMKEDLRKSLERYTY
jgi:hypothetical protein